MYVYVHEGSVDLTDASLNWSFSFMREKKKKREDKDYTCFDLKLHYHISHNIPNANFSLVFL